MTFNIKQLALLLIVLLTSCGGGSGGGGGNPNRDPNPPPQTATFSAVLTAVAVDDVAAGQGIVVTGLPLMGANVALD